jgi:hypothetical protein
MKKIITLITLLTLTVTLTSCYVNNNTPTTEEKKPTIIKPFSFDSSQLGIGSSGIVPGSDKHEYLVTHYLTDHQGIEHYIDCEFCLKREQATYGNH